MKPKFTNEAQEEGRQAALKFQAENRDPDTEDFPKCPWPLYSIEGNAWFHGWNEESGSGNQRRPNTERP